MNRPATQPVPEEDAPPFSEEQIEYILGLIRGVIQEEDLATIASELEDRILRLEENQFEQKETIEELWKEIG